jgi:GT2 family glycosyltransferase
VGIRCLMINARSRAMAVLIVAYRSADMLEKCIQSVERYLPGLDVHVWDNSGPTCSDVRRLADGMPHLHWYLNSENIGFAAAVNRLAAMVPGRDFLLLNPDAELVGPLTLTRAAIRDPGTAAAAPMIWELGVEDGPASLLSGARLPWDVAHRRRTFLNALCAQAVRAERLRGTCLSDLYRSQPGDIDGYLTGACLAIRREAWDSLGPFDEEFFLYGEEADWQRRAVAAGWRVRLEDEVGARHSVQGTVTGDPLAHNRSWDVLRANMALQLEYQYGLRAAEFYLAWVSLIESMKRSLLHRGDRGAPPSDVLVTVDEANSAAASERVSLALALDRGGCAVTVVSLRRLGTLPRDLPTSIRLLRRPWWWPSTSPGGTPAVLVVGTTKRERAFARLFRLRRNRVCLESSAAISSLLDVTCSRKETVVSHDVEGA